MNRKCCSNCKHLKVEQDEPCISCDENSSGWEPKAQVTAPDPTNPQHYREFPVEVIQLVRHLNFNRGNAVKYLCRAGRKNLTPGQELEDLKKALWYVQDEIQRLTGEGDHAKP